MRRGGKQPSGRRDFPDCKQTKHFKGNADIISECGAQHIVSSTSANAGAMEGFVAHEGALQNRHPTSRGAIRSDKQGRVFWYGEAHSR